MPISRHENNFDLVRLLAAMQVMAYHLLLHFGYSDSLIFRMVNLFPGVPVFFAISGYLVSQSLARSDGVRDYAGRRFRRIFPALWGAVAFSAVTVAVLHPIEIGTLMPWLLAQATLFPQWNPEALRTYGVGVVNGSLWSIPVEVSFYVMLPFLARLGSRWLAVLAALSFAFMYLSIATLTGMGLKLALVSPLPYFGMFIGGMLLERSGHRPKLNFWTFAFLIVVVATIVTPIPGLLVHGGNTSGLLNFIALTGLAFGAAFTRPIRLPGDISYGLYLYHMPVLNAAMALGYAGPTGFAVTVATTVILACASWCLIEHTPRASSRPRAWRRPGYSRPGRSARLNAAGNHSPKDAICPDGQASLSPSKVRPGLANGVR